MAGPYGATPFVSLWPVTSVYDTLPRGLELGTEQVVDGKKYRLFYNSSGAGGIPLTTGMGFTFGTAGGFYVAASGQACTAAAAAGYVPLAGFIDQVATASTGQYFWGMVKGYVTNALACGANTVASPVAGYMLQFGGAGNGGFDRAFSQSAANAVSGYQPLCGYICSTAATACAMSCYLVAWGA